MMFLDYYHRHVGPREKDLGGMLSSINEKTLDDLIKGTIPESILNDQLLKEFNPLSENDYLRHFRDIIDKNKLLRTYIGMGYYNTIMPSVIRRNIFENPSWYTSYTPYQAEISQGRLEALLNFQTMVTDLTRMEIANASLLDESTAAAEAMLMMYNSRTREQVKSGIKKILVDKNTFPQTIEVIKTRAENYDIELIVEDHKQIQWDESYFGIIVQYPGNDGNIEQLKPLVDTTHQTGAMICVIADLMSLVMLDPPGNWGADVVVGSTQQFGIPMGYGGPHAAYFATREKYKRMVPGRIIGVSVDKNNRTALRMALQTREQHIKRERATSNICTAQALLAIMAGMYAIYNGPEGLSYIATQIAHYTQMLACRLEKIGIKQTNSRFFDTLRLELSGKTDQKTVKKFAMEENINLRYFHDGAVGISIDETTSISDLEDILRIFEKSTGKKSDSFNTLEDFVPFENGLRRKDSFLTHPVFNSYHSESEMMRYIKRLERKDISLTDSMISLGSCTMKLNAASTLIPLEWDGVAHLHPFVPISQTEGYQQIFYELGNILKNITGFDGISFQPNSGAAGEYSGLIVIKKYHQSRGENQRNIILIPESAHGTNPASAVMAGGKVVVIKCDERGNIDMQDLRSKAEEYRDTLSALMVTYPSTHGVFEPSIMEITRIIHDCGGQVYMDGANMNAQVGLTSPAIIGADVCHLNLHKTFGIPHGGGGPGVGPICVASHLTEFLPSHPVIPTGGINGVGPVAASPWGSASIIIISYAYCKLLGSKGLREVTKMAILNSNYLAALLAPYYKILYTGKNNRVAHEMIIDCREFRETAGISEIDIAKRLIDYGFHAPTVSFPVHGTLMIEPTESESLEELNRFAEAMISIHREIQEIIEEKIDKENNPLKNAPHSIYTITANEWNYPYSREKAAYPLPYLKQNKVWATVDRINDAWGDRNLVCTCSDIKEYASVT